MFLPDVEQHEDHGPRGHVIKEMQTAGIPVPQILHLFAFKSAKTRHLAAFTQGVMRGESALTPGQRELIAAFTSKRNQCPF
jgi:alkylhydroperoxidase family enzyme